jgi:hypothetical protein
MEGLPSVISRSNGEAFLHDADADASHVPYRHLAHHDYIQPSVDDKDGPADCCPQVSQFGVSTSIVARSLPLPFVRAAHANANKDKSNGDFQRRSYFLSAPPYKPYGVLELGLS